MEKLFKVGDKVRYIGTYFAFSKQKPIGVIMTLGGKYIQVVFKNINDFPFTCYGHELEFIVKVGEQLEFDFMSNSVA